MDEQQKEIERLAKLLRIYQYDPYALMELEKRYYTEQQKKLREKVEKYFNIARKKSTILIFTSPNNRRLSK